MAVETKSERRRQLIEAAGTFLLRVAGIPGVRRIALLGSLTTGKTMPKDVDLLVTVDDDADLTALARAGRQLMGGLQSRSSGADVFLANPQGEYIGRLCQWRECAAGIRRGCDALNCGRREFLHDDFGSIRLPASLVQAPPVDVWPVFLARKRLPPDLRAALKPWEESGTAGQVLEHRP